MGSVGGHWSLWSRTPKPDWQNMGCAQQLNVTFLEEKKEMYGHYIPVVKNSLGENILIYCVLEKFKGFPRGLKCSENQNTKQIMILENKTTDVDHFNSQHIITSLTTHRAARSKCFVVNVVVCRSKKI